MESPHKEFYHLKQINHTIYIPPNNANPNSPNLNDTNPNNAIAINMMEARPSVEPDMCFSCDHSETVYEILETAETENTIIYSSEDWTLFHSDEAFEHPLQFGPFNGYIDPAVNWDNPNHPISHYIAELLKPLLSKSGIILTSTPQSKIRK